MFSINTFPLLRSCLSSSNTLILTLRKVLDSASTCNERARSESCSGQSDLSKLMDPESILPPARRGLRVCRGLGLPSFPVLQPKLTPLQGLGREECTPALHPPLHFPSRGAGMEAPLWKATKTPGIRTLCFLSFSLPPHPSLSFPPSLCKGCLQ